MCVQNKVIIFSDSRQTARRYLYRPMCGFRLTLHTGKITCYLKGYMVYIGYGACAPRLLWPTWRAPCTNSEVTETGACDGTCDGFGEITMPGRVFSPSRTNFSLSRGLACTQLSMKGCHPMSVCEMQRDKNTHVATCTMPPPIRVKLQTIGYR